MESMAGEWAMRLENGKWEWKGWGGHRSHHHSSLSSVLFHLTYVISCTLFHVRDNIWNMEMNGTMDYGRGQLLHQHHWDPHVHTCT